MIAGALRRLGVAEADAWAVALAPACRRHAITTRARLSAFLGNLHHESGGFARLVESLNYGLSGLLKTFGRHRISAADAARFARLPGRPAAQREIANRIYGGEWGRVNLGNTQPDDGWFFRGRGLIQLTGRDNYTRFAKAIGVSVVDLPAILETKEGAAESAAAFFRLSGCNELADRGDTAGVRRRINGGALGLAEVRHASNEVSLALAAGGAGMAA